MFDIGFWELMLIGIMGLVVLGPERLPVAIRTLRGWITGVRKFSETVKSELTEELRIHELHANLKKAEEGGMANLSPEVAESVKSLQEAAAMVNKPYEDLEITTISSSSKANSPKVIPSEDNSSKTDEKVNASYDIDEDKRK